LGWILLALLSKTTGVALAHIEDFTIEGQEKMIV
jgi:hypothetical protein